jgi:hypothetical protein
VSDIEKKFCKIWHQVLQSLRGEAAVEGFVVSVKPENRSRVRRYLHWQSLQRKRTKKFSLATTVIL